MVWNVNVVASSNPLSIPRFVLFTPIEQHLQGIKEIICCSMVDSIPICASLAKDRDPKIPLVRRLLGGILSTTIVDV